MRDEEIGEPVKREIMNWSTIDLDRSLGMQAHKAMKGLTKRKSYDYHEVRNLNVAGYKLNLLLYNSPRSR